MFNQLRQWYGALRRGEQRIAPYGARGRVFARPEESNEGPSLLSADAEPVAVIHMKITRGDGSVERVSVPATVTKV